MRFLIAFLCCYAIQFQYTHAAEQGTSSPKKSQYKFSRCLVTLKGKLPIEPKNSFSKDFMDQRCASQQQNQIRTQLNGDFPGNINIPDLQSVYLHFVRFKNLQKLSYQSIFNFLDPKHAFW